MSDNRIPPGIIAERVQVLYQLHEGERAIPFTGHVIGVDPVLIIDHGDNNPKFVRSYLYPERIVSIMVLREEQPK